MPTVITGTDGINQVQAGSIQSDDLAAGAITIGSGDLPAGSVIQVVHTTNQNFTEIRSTSFQSAPLVLSITPLFASSSILILSNFNIGQDGDDSNASQGRFLRDNSVEVGAFITGRDMVSFSTNVNVGVQLIDTPATTSSVQYQLQLRGRSGNTRVRYLYEYDAFSGSEAKAYLTLMEIAG